MLSALRGKTVGLTPTGCVLIFEALNPIVVEQSSQSAVESARAQHDPPVAHMLNVFQNRIPVARLFDKTQKDQEDGLAQWLGFMHMTVKDMS